MPGSISQHRRSCDGHAENGRSMKLDCSSMITTRRYEKMNRERSREDRSGFFGISYPKLCEISIRAVESILGVIDDFLGFIHDLGF